ncbi:hypothetical protein Bca101_049477 [Brassica carinata]
MCNYRESNGSPSSSSWRRRFAVVVMDLESVVLYLTGGTNREGNTPQCHGYQLVSMVVLSFTFLLQVIELIPVHLLLSSRIRLSAARYCRRCFAFLWSMRLLAFEVRLYSGVLALSSEASYTGDDMGILGIQGNDENLTFSWSSSMVENGN